MMACIRKEKIKNEQACFKVANCEQPCISEVTMCSEMLIVIPQLVGVSKVFGNPFENIRCDQ